MNPDDQVPPPPPAPGPLEDAYLHRDIHPDDHIEGHAPRPQTGSLLFPEAHSANDNPDDVSMFV